MEKNILNFSLSLTILLIISCGGLGTSSTGGSSSVVTGNDASSAAGAVIGGLLDSFGSKTNANTIVGTWIYEEPAVQFESDNLLAKAGSGIVNSQVEKQIESYYNGIGISRGTFSITFNSNKSCSYIIKNKEYSGSYEFDSSTNKISITSNGLLSLPSAYAKVSGSSLELTFETTALFNIAKTIGSSSGNSTLGALSSIANNYSGMKTGFHFNKKK